MKFSVKFNREISSLETGNYFCKIQDKTHPLFEQEIIDDGFSAAVFIKG